METTPVFIHGLESSGRGTKGTYFRKRYPNMIIEDYSGSFLQRMEKLEGHLKNKSRLILVGSSFGGLMAAGFACKQEDRVEKLVLLAPALHLELFEPFRDIKLKLPVIIYHGLQDTVVPLEDVRILAEKLYGNLEFNAVQDDHFLHDTFPTLDWTTLLS